MEQKGNETFRYSYSPAQREEIENIRRKYAPREESKLEQLRRLDAGVTGKATAAALAVGIIGCLVFGGGMSCALTMAAGGLLPGIILGVVGLVGVACAYPLYLRVVRKERERIAPEILRLTDELTEGES